MKRWVLILAACGGSKTVEPGPSGSAVAPVSIDAAVVAPAPPPPPSYKVEAPPGGKIVRFAVTPAEDAALTVDDSFEVRLWPTLDGKQPPIAVELPAATTLALQRSGADFVALLGVPGGALVVRIGADGKRQSVVELAAIDGALASDAGFVTWSGKHVEWLDVAGKVTRASDTEPRPSPPVTKVTAKDSDLVVGGRYLGYAFPLREVPAGRDAGHVVVRGAGNRFLQITTDLTVVGELVPPNTDATAMTWVGDRDWLVDTPAGVVLWTEGAAAGTLVGPKLEVAQVETRSHLVLLSELQAKNATAPPKKQLARYADHKLAPIAFTAWGKPGTTVDLIPPAANRGALLVLQQFERDEQSVAHGHAQWIHDLDHPDQGMTRWDGERAWPLITTGSGALVINHEAKHYSLVIDGEPKFDYASDEVLSDDTTRVLRRTSDGKAELAKRGGATLWTFAVPGHGPRWNITLMWRGDRIWLWQPQGLAVLDPATGTVRRAISGWGFELSPTPHPPSTLGRPITVDLATRDAPLVLAADTKFQALARAVAAQSSTVVLWFGPVKLDGGIHRVAFLESPAINGSPLFAYLIEVAPDAIVAVTCQMSGFPAFQGPFDALAPAWGTIQLPDGSDVRSTLDAAPLALHSQWIHGSSEDLTFTLERGELVVVSDAWVERENTGSSEPGKRYQTTTGGKQFPAGRRQKLATFKGHTASFLISPKTSSAGTLAAAIHPLDP